MQEPEAPPSSVSPVSLLSDTAETLLGARAGARPLLRDERRAMLTQIARVGLAIGRDLFPSLPLHDSDTEPVVLEADDPLPIGQTPVPQEASPRERVQFLLTALPRVEAALNRLEAAPPSDLRLQPQTVSLSRARRPRPKDWLTALARGASPNVPAQEAKVTDWRPVPEVDIAVSRWVKATLAVWARDLSAVADLALLMDAPLVARDAQTVRRRLRAHLTRFPWQHLPLVPARVETVPVSAWQNPHLRLLRDLARTYQRGFAFDWRTALFHLPPREDWLLYEQWCVFQVANALRLLGFRAIDAPDFRIGRSGLTFTLVKGRASALRFEHPDGQATTVYYSRPFARGRADRDGLLSRSHAMRPDIVVEASGHLLVLDAKLKGYAEPESAEETNTPLTDDVNQCHAYRDGIRWKGGRRAVSGAWLLYAGRPSSLNRSIVAYPAASLTSPFGAGEIGALLLRPTPANATGLPILTDLLTRFLHDARR